VAMLLWQNINAHVADFVHVLLLVVANIKKLPNVMELDQSHIMCLVSTMDYTYLEGVSRAVDVSDRLLSEKYNFDTDQESYKRYHQNLVYKAAHRRGINYFSMHRGMQRNQLNTSRFTYKTLTIFWQVEWIFPELENKTFYNRTSEKYVLSEVLKKSIMPQLTDDERKYFAETCSEDYVFLLKMEKQTSSNKTYFRLSPNSTLLNSLKGKCIIEFPTIYVYKESPKNPEFEISCEEVRILGKNDCETSKSMIIQSENFKDDDIDIEIEIKDVNDDELKGELRIESGTDSEIERDDGTNNEIIKDEDESETESECDGIYIDVIGRIY
ncbi:8967_t:CDS:2, partial [Ambispora leptoticha]